MPKARVIARDPQRAQQTVESLHASGYEVEVVAPGEPQVEPCELTVNLEDLPAGQSTYSLDEAASYFVDEDQPAKREFIFAPAWRKLSGFARSQYSAMQQRRAERQPAAVPHSPEPRFETPQPPQLLDYERIAAEFSAQREQLEASFAAQLEAIKEERRAQGAEILRLQQELAVIRQQNEFLSQSHFETQVAQPASAPVVESEPTRKLSELKPRFEEFAQRAQRIASDSSRRAGRAALVAASSLRDLTMRPSFSVAAGIVFAFLLGFWAATGKRQPEARQLTPEIGANVSSANVVPASAAVEKKAAPKAATPKVRKPSPIKQVAVNKNGGGSEEVVVRHYPTRGNIAKSESPNKVRQYSDIDDEQ